MLPSAVLVLALVGGATAPRASAPGSTDSVAARLRRLEAAVQRGRADSARAALAPIVAPASASRQRLLEAGVLASLTYRPADAEALLGRVLDADAEDAIAAEAGIWLAELARRAGRPREAAERLRRARAIAQASGDPSREAEALVYRSVAALQAGQLPAATALLDTAEILVPTSDASGRARVRCQRGVLLAYAGDAAGARAALGAGRLEARAAGDTRLEGQCLAAEGMRLAQQGRWSLAAVVLDTAARTSGHGRDARTLAVALQWQGFALRMLAQFSRAERALRAAIERGEEAGDWSPRAWARLNLGLIAASFGDHEGAAREFDLASRAFAMLGDRWGEHATLLSRGQQLLRVGALSEADSALCAVAAFADGARNAQLAWAARHEMALVGLRRGDFAGASARLDTLERVAGAARQANDLLALAYTRGVLWLAQGQPARAEPLLRRFVAELDPRVHARRYAGRARLAEALALTGDLAGAARELEAAMVDLDAWRSTLDDEALRRAVLTASVDDSDADLGVATVVAHLAVSGDPQRAFGLAERRRARVLLDRLARINPVGDDTLRPRGAVPAVRLVDAAGARRALPDGATALVSFVTGGGGEPTTAFVLTRDTVVATLLIPEDSLRAIVTRLRTLLEAREAVPTALIDALATALTAPLAPLLPAGVRRLLLAPDGLLHHVPFALLPGPDGRPLGTSLAVDIVPSASVFAALRAQPRLAPSADVLALADAPDLSEAGRPSLAGARAEVRALRRAVEGVRAYVGLDAREAVLRTDHARRVSVVHLATHTVVDDRSPLGTYVALASGGGHDGRLDAGEVTSLHLRADVVVLSACRTASGRVLTGEGVEGLTAPLLSGGVRAVVASRWDVDDQATARLMADLYAALVEGEPVGDALQRARLAAIDRAEPPSVWAAFTVVGDPFAAPPLEPRSPVAARLAATGVGLLVLALVRQRRQRVRG